MNQVLIYIIQVNILLSIIYLGYCFLLKGLTFYRLNRGYLVIASLYALVYPLLDVPSWFRRQAAIDMPVVWGYLPDGLLEEAQVVPSVLTLDNVVLALLGVGAVLLLLRLIVQLLSLFRIHCHSSLSQWGRYLYRNVLYPVVPFSFLNKIYVHKAQHSEPELYDIFEHENIHVKGLHSLDILLFEMLWIGCWYNPFVWLMRKAVRQNLEYLTDQQVLNKGIDRQTYQYSLLHVTQQGAAVGIGNQFNFKTLKKRIMMMNKRRSSKLELSKYALLLPILILAGASFTISKAEDKINRMVDMAKETGLNEIIPRFQKSNVTKPEEELQKNFGFLLDDKLVEIEVVKQLDVKDIERMTMHMDNSLTKRYGLKTVTEIETKKFAGTVGTPSQFKFVNFQESGQITVDGPLSGRGGNDRDERTVSALDNPKQDTIQRTKAITRRLKNRLEIDQRKDYVYEYDGKAISKSDFLALAENEVYDILLIEDRQALSAFYPKEADKHGIIRARSLEGHERSKERSKLLLYIIDGVERTAADMEKVNPDEIESVNVLKDDHAVSKYGEKGKHGVIEIKTKGHASPAADTFKTKRKELGELVIRGQGIGTNPRIVVDGKPMHPDFEIKSMRTDDIESVSVLKDAAAMAVYGEKGKDGVIIVTTKPKLEVRVEGFKERQDSLNKTIQTNIASSINRIWSAPTLSKPAYIVDGKLVGNKEYAKIDRSEIKSISTMTKDQANSFYNQKYDLKDHDGVVAITTN